MSKKEKRSLVWWVLDKHTRMRLEDWPAAKLKRFVREHYNRRVSKKIIRRCQREFVPNVQNLWPVCFN